MAPDPNSPIRHFQADYSFSNSESATGMSCANVWSAAGFYEVEEGIPPHVLRKYTKGCAQDKFVQKTGRQIRNNGSDVRHTAPGGAVLRGGRRIFRAPATSGRNVTG